MYSHQTDLILNIYVNNDKIRPPLKIFFKISKSNHIYNLFFFLTFSKIELDIFCQKIKAIGLPTAFFVTLYPKMISKL